MWYLRFKQNIYLKKIKNTSQKLCWAQFFQCSKTSYVDIGFLFLFINTDKCLFYKLNMTSMYVTIKAVCIMKSVCHINSLSTCIRIPPYIAYSWWRTFPVFTFWTPMLSCKYFQLSTISNCLSHITRLVQIHWEFISTLPKVRQNLRVVVWLVTQ